MGPLTTYLGVHFQAIYKVRLAWNSGWNSWFTKPALACPPASLGLPEAGLAQQVHLAPDAGFRILLGEQASV